MVGDPVASAVLTEYLDLFVEDPATRLEMEGILDECNRTNPGVELKDFLNLAQLRAQCELYRNTRDWRVKRGVKHVCRSAILQFIERYRWMKGETQ